VFFADGKAGNVGAGGRKRVDYISLAENVAEVQSVTGSEVVIEANAELIVVGGLAERGDKSIAAGVGRRKKRQKILRDGTDEGNLVERQRLRRRREDIVELAIGVAAHSRTVESSCSGGAKLAEVADAFV